MTTRVLKRQAQLDLSQTEPKYLDSDGIDNKWLHPQAITETVKLPNILSVELAPDLLKALREAYPSDEEFGRIYEKTLSNQELRGAYQIDSRGILWWDDPNLQHRLCMPQSLRREFLKEIHDSPHGVAHVGQE